MDKKNIFLVVSIAALIFSIFSVTYPTLISPIGQGISDGDVSPGIMVLDGNYEGFNFFNSTVLVEENGKVTFSNGTFVGTTIYVTGQLNATNCTINMDIVMNSSGELKLVNCSVSQESRIFGYDSCRIDLNNVDVLGTLSMEFINLVAYDNSQVLLNDTGLTCSFNDESIVNGSWLQSRTGNPIPFIEFKDDSNSTLQNSSFNVMLYGNYFIEGFGIRHEFKNSTGSFVFVYANLSVILRDYSEITQLVGYQNSTIYKEASCTVTTFVPYDNSQLIDI